MPYDPGQHHRRSIRLQRYDYAQMGAYFITICTHGRECLFGEVTDGAMQLNEAGYMIQSVWNELPCQFAGVDIDAFVVMPNHVHGIILINDEPDTGMTDPGRGEPCVRPVSNGDEFRIRPVSTNRSDLPNRSNGTLSGAIGRVIQAYKSITTLHYITGVKNQGWPPFFGKLWQRNYYEHIIRNDIALDAIRQYIQTNPVQWTLDEENPNNTRR
jgi:putative transposase